MKRVEQPNVAILSFNFGNYDVVKDSVLNPNYEYLYVTDNNAPKGWKKVELKTLDYWQSSVYVRYHPFEFTEADVIVVIDSSLLILNDLHELVDSFINIGNDIALLLSEQPNLMKRVTRWISSNRISEDEYNFLTKFNLKYNGCLANCLRIVTRKAIPYLEKCFSIIKENNIRLDEVVSTLILEQFPNLKCFVLPQQVVNGDFFYITSHSSGKVTTNNSYKKVDYYFKNEPILLNYIGSQYQRKYEYESEAICITKYSNAKDIVEWIEHHLSLGFSHIHIIDNESNYNLKEIALSYSNVSYEYVEGEIRQYRILDEYINQRSKAEWVIPIDDDEYLQLRVSNVHELFSYQNSNMFAVRWVHKFPKVFHSERSIKVLEYCTEESPKLAKQFSPIGDFGIKTFVRRFGNVHYQETDENPYGGHVPIHSVSFGASYGNETITSCRCYKVDLNELAVLLHCRYKGYSDWLHKSNCITISNKTHKLKEFHFNKLLEQLP